MPFWTHIAVHDLYKFKWNRIPAWRRGSGHKVIPLTKKLFTIGNCLERKNTFSPMEWHWVFHSHCREGLRPRNSWIIQNELHKVLYTLFACFIWFFGFEVLWDLCYLFLVLILFSFFSCKSEKAHEVGSVGRGREPGNRWEMRKNIFIKQCMKN